MFYFFIVLTLTHTFSSPDSIKYPETIKKQVLQIGRLFLLLSQDYSENNNELKLLQYMHNPSSSQNLFL